VSTLVPFRITIVGSLWTSGTDTASRGNFVWKASGRSVNGGYTNWAPQEPSGPQGCIQLWAEKGYQWDDQYCSVEKKPLCQYSRSDESGELQELQELLEKKKLQEGVTRILQEQNLRYCNTRLPLSNPFM
jgi:hypothetical protein